MFGKPNSNVVLWTILVTTIIYPKKNKILVTIFKALSCLCPSQDIWEICEQVWAGWISLYCVKREYFRITSLSFLFPPSWAHPGGTRRTPCTGMWKDDVGPISLWIRWVLHKCVKLFYINVWSSSVKTCKIWRRKKKPWNTPGNWYRANIGTLVMSSENS